MKLKNFRVDKLEKTREDKLANIEKNLKLFADPGIYLIRVLISGLSDKIDKLVFAKTLVKLQRSTYLRNFFITSLFSPSYEECKLTWKFYSRERFYSFLNGYNRESALIVNDYLPDKNESLSPLISIFDPGFHGSGSGSSRIRNIFQDCLRLAILVIDFPDLEKFIRFWHEKKFRDLSGVQTDIDRLRWRLTFNFKFDDLQNCCYIYAFDYSLDKSILVGKLAYNFIKFLIKTIDTEMYYFCNFA
ncbi:hypothetical protein [Candidatus Phytoplasma australasiaticum]|uniref:hypothetical protein n=1 Tax=Candidatus Phytoplasma australasiaticum TaxID=2754999 RepID=UPI00271251F8|nr:hypothetical protein [Candidatus Phytoplasma australasiaticum]MDO8031769.1 hypothetical protein [Candidatus Phytoplasma australasiaticum]MDO8053819.1 hypothetical protein [Candidatus Phytoplasma australasiaticum]MDV3138168.1 hypothetical protein [Candidatus Phytoplasma australasiaticum]MDV3139039.1 hypothetical protein [Candidatus Phytoplasma australasiaticum]MDV3140939.1 hypothetical protein [Candidatus Phytoplasma australasiaticum]